MRTKAKELEYKVALRLARVVAPGTVVPDMYVDTKLARAAIDEVVRAVLEELYWSKEIETSDDAFNTVERRLRALLPEQGT